jgi:membrane protein implicated in regulation of membrane protease activity
VDAGNLRVARNGRDGMRGSQSGRFLWGSYGFLAGILLGVFIGWFFAGFIFAFIRVAMLALVIVPVVLVFLAWRRYVTPWLRPPAEPRYVGPANAIETRAVVHESVADPRTW